jgi:hypothetical protein
MSVSPARAWKLKKVNIIVSNKVITGYLLSRDLTYYSRRTGKGYRPGIKLPSRPIKKPLT